jgi:hypothetical protein
MKPVLVTTAHRGVFFGYVKDESNKPASITLTGVRNVIRWADCGGLFGLAAKGPNSSCRIGEKSPEITLYNLTSVTDVADEAVKAWEETKTWSN